VQRGGDRRGERDVHLGHPQRQERAERARAFRELASRLDRQREEHQRAAVAEERMRIGRELQDIVAQSVSAIVVQAGGARQLIRSDPDRACKSIHAVEEAGRESLADLRRALMLLHPMDATVAPAPRPGLAQLGGLVAAMRESGVTCTLETGGCTVPAAVGVDLLGYRLVEAALGIAAEHGASRASVAVAQRGARLELHVMTDTAVDDAAERLREISERVALYDGVVHVSPGTGHGGFTVEVQLPARGDDQ
jgi:signal transduction histidine kinase